MSKAATIRAQLDLMAEIRDRVSELCNDYERWYDALAPLTDSLIRELHEAECEAAGVAHNPWHSIHGHEVRWDFP